MRIDISHIVYIGMYINTYVWIYIYIYIYEFNSFSLYMSNILFHIIVSYLPTLYDITNTSNIFIHVYIYLYHVFKSLSTVPHFAWSNPNFDAKKGNGRRSIVNSSLFLDHVCPTTNHCPAAAHRKFTVYMILVCNSSLRTPGWYNYMVIVWVPKEILHTMQDAVIGLRVCICVHLSAIVSSESIRMCWCYVA